MPRVRVAAVIIEADQILLVRHQKADQTYWLLPGGGVDYGETLPAALRREVKEETNLDIEVGEALFISDAIHPKLERHIINIYFAVTVTGGELESGVDGVLIETKLIKLSKLSNLTLFPDIKLELSRYLNGNIKALSYLGQRWQT